MIELRNLNFKYTNSEDDNGLKGINLRIKRGELVVVCGKSGSGKTTITRILNGLAPDYYTGDLSGDIIIDNKNMRGRKIYDYVGLVGSVFQNPRSQFYNIDVMDELAFGAENMCVEKEEIIKRISDSVKNFDIEKLINRSLFDLSGGEKQKIACASVNVMGPELFVLDEPTSNLDFTGIELLRKSLEFWKAKGKTIVISEHRLHWLRDMADRYVYLDHGEIKGLYTKTEFLNISNEQRCKMGLRSSNPFGNIGTDLNQQDIKTTENENNHFIEIKNLKFSYKKKTVLNIENLSISSGEVSGITGSNGAGKSTLAKCLCGLEKKLKCEILIDGKALKPKKLIEKSYMVMQDVNHQLFTESVMEEVILSMDYNLDEDEQKEKAGSILKDLNLYHKKDLHPMSLSGGEKQRLAIASALASSKPIIIFDEPTSGLDYINMKEVAAQILKIKPQKTILIISHDPELINLCCEKLILMEKGRIKWMGRPGLQYGGLSSN